MRGVARLVYTYFMGAPISRALTLVGLALCVLSVLVVTYLPQSEHMLSFALSGQLAVFVGGGYMPMLMGRLAQAHAVRLVPRSRLKLLASAFITVALVVLPIGLLAPAAYIAGNGGKLSDVGKYPALGGFLVDLALVTYTSTFIVAGWLYLGMWFLGSQRNWKGVAKALLLAMLLLLVPARQIRELSASTQMNLIQIAIAWTIFGAGFLCWPRIRRFFSRNPVAAPREASGAIRHTSGKEVAFILGIDNPWLHLAGLALPVALALGFSHLAPEVWLLVLTIFSATAGAIAGQAPARSRALWLRLGWSREELFAQVERAFWRHNGVTLAVLAILLTLYASYVHLAGIALAAGLPLLALGTSLSSYLGLMSTRGLRWIEISVGAAVMLALMAVAMLLTAERVNVLAVTLIETVLAALALVLREVARRRWARIDWVECRRERLPLARG
jgi:hypothetical protein